ncbi:MAG: hypothetical protein ABS58_12920 [Mesorhizobium sp. SCN 65-20]|nr:MAG: hypothetical protein ABS58_12920 [Mesorhizobium sp. SCN 65-20]
MAKDLDIATAPERRSVLAGLRFLMRCYDRHLQRLHLSDLDDKALDDIGLTRREVGRECAKPFWR